MNASRLLELDPAISADQAAAAHDASPVDYEVVFREIAARLAQDQLDAGDVPRGLAPVIPAKPAAAIATARDFHARDVNVGIGFCLRTVRTYFDVPALWPDAETAWDHGGSLSKPITRHRETDPEKMPRGSVGYAVNDRHGHVWLNVGGGLCWTTDFVRPGFIDLAPVAKMAPWIGGRLVGWAELLNGWDVWPTQHPKPKPVFDLEDRHALVHRALETARTNHAPGWKLDGLREWDAHLEARLADHAGGKK